MRRSVWLWPHDDEVLRQPLAVPAQRQRGGQGQRRWRKAVDHQVIDVALGQEGRPEDGRRVDGHMPVWIGLTYLAIAPPYRAGIGLKRRPKVAKGIGLLSWLEQEQRGVRAGVCVDPPQEGVIFVRRMLLDDSRRHRLLHQMPKV